MNKSFNASQRHDVRDFVKGAVLSGSPGTAIPIRGAQVGLYKATSGAPRLLGTAVTNAEGCVSIGNAPVGGDSAGIFYVTADLSRDVQLVSIIGPVLTHTVIINELTTVAAGYSMAQFTKGGVLSGDEFGLQLATGMNDNLTSPDTG